MAQKRGLGRGLNTLIPNAPIIDEVEEEVKETKPKKTPAKKKIASKKTTAKKATTKKTTTKKEEEKKKPETTLPINKIEPNPDQPRTQFDEDGLEELSASIKQYGVLQPILVQKRDKFYEIIAGERRWRAAKMAGLKEVPVIIREFTNNEVLEIALIENIQRENLNPIEEAIAYRKLMDEFNLKQDEVADRVSKSRVTITNALRLLKLDERVQSMLSDEMISMGHARALLAIPSLDLQYETAMKAFDEKLSVRDVESLVKEINNPTIVKKKVTSTSVNDVLFTGIEEEMKHILGSKVSIKNKKNNKGKIEIEYYSRDELERIVDMIKSI